MSVPSATVTSGASTAPLASPVPDAVVVHVGCSSKGPYTATKLGRYQDAVSQFGCGKLVKAFAYANAKAPREAILVRLPPTARNATTSAVDTAGLTGTIDPSVSGTPNDNYEVKVVCTTTGTTGTSFSYKVSLNGGQDFGDPVAAGTSLSISLTGTGLTISYSTAKSINEDDYFEFSTHAASQSILPLTLTRDDASTAEITASGSPEDDYEIVFEILSAGTLLTTGITYRYSLDGGRTWTKPLSLNTAKTVALLDGPTEASGVTLALEPNEDELVTLANELRTDYEAHRVLLGFEDALVALANDIKDQYEAHRVLTAGSVHGAADSTNDVTASDATDLTTAITLLNELADDYEAHRVLTAGSVHGAADNTNAITAATATNGVTAVALAIDLKTQYEAHRALTAGSVHGAADSTNDVTEDDPTYVHGLADSTNSVSASAATTRATAITLLNELRTDYEAHRILTTGGVHGGADSTNAIEAAVATDAHTAVTLANDMKEKFNAHRVRISGSVHDVADSTNAVTGDDVGHGTFDVGDTLRFGTMGPEWQASDYTAAMVALGNTSHKWSFIHPVGTCSRSIAGSVGTQNASFEAAQRFTWSLLSARDWGTNEAPISSLGERYITRWASRLTTDFDGFTDERIARCAGRARITCPVTGRQNRRDISWIAVPRLIARPTQEELSRVLTGALSSDVIISESGLAVEYDARLNSVLHDAGFVTLRTYVEFDGVFVTLGNMSGVDANLIPLRRVKDIADAVLQQEMARQIGLSFRRWGVGAKSPYVAGDIYEPDAKRIEKAIYNRVKRETIDKGRCSAISLVLARTPISLGGGKWRLSFVFKITALGYVVELTAESSFTDPALDALLA